MQVQQEATNSSRSSSRAGPAPLSDLLQPLLGAEATSAQQGATAFQAPPDLEAQEAFDPFPATTAARRAAAEVTRAKAAAPAAPAHSTDNLRAALLGRAASTAAVAVAGQSAEAARFQRQLSFAYGLSWVVNILLLAAKLYAYWLSHSKAVLASAADSAVDLVRWVGLGWLGPAPSCTAPVCFPIAGGPGKNVNHNTLASCTAESAAVPGWLSSSLPSQNRCSSLQQSPSPARPPAASSVSCTVTAAPRLPFLDRCLLSVSLLSAVCLSLLHLYTGQSDGHQLCGLQDAVGGPALPGRAGAPGGDWCAGM